MDRHEKTAVQAAFSFVGTQEKERGGQIRTLTALYVHWTQIHYRSRRYEQIRLVM